MARPRPICIYYPGGTMGHTINVRNAIVAATRRLLDERYDDHKTHQVNIMHEASHVADVVRTARSVQVKWAVGWIMLEAA